MPEKVYPLPDVPKGFRRLNKRDAIRATDICDNSGNNPGYKFWSSVGVCAVGTKYMNGFHLPIIRAVKHPSARPAPAKAKQCGKGMQAGDKFRTCEKPCGHKGACETTLCGARTKAKAKRAGKPVKAQRRYQSINSGGYKKGDPVFVLPADAASVEKMVAQCAQRLDVADYETSTDAAKAMLASLGIRA